MAKIEPKPLDTNIYFDILYFLSQNGLFKKVPIKGILDKYFTYDDYDNYSDRDEAIKWFLNKMVLNKHIEYDTVLLKEGSFEVDLVFLCAITIEGLMFHIKIQENTSMLLTNQISAESLKTNRSIAIIAVVISFLGLIFAIYNPFKNDEIGDLKSQLSQQKTQLKYINQEISKVKNSSFQGPLDKKNSKK